MVTSVEDKRTEWLLILYPISVDPINPMHLTFNWLTILLTFLSFRPRAHFYIPLLNAWPAEWRPPSRLCKYSTSETPVTFSRRVFLEGNFNHRRSLRRVHFLSLGQVQEAHADSQTTFIIDGVQPLCRETTISTQVCDPSCVRRGSVHRSWIRSRPQ